MGLPPTWYISFFSYCWEGQASSCRIWKFLASMISLISRRLSKQFRQLLPLGVLQSQPIEFLRTKFSHIYLSFEYSNDEDFVQKCLCGLSIWVSTIQRAVSPGSLRVIEGNLLRNPLSSVEHHNRAVLLGEIYLNLFLPASTFFRSKKSSKAEPG